MTAPPSSGDRAPARRRPSGQTVLSVVGGLVGLAFAIALFRVLGPDTAASTQLRGYVVESDTSVSIEFEVARDPGSTVHCLVRARGTGGGEVGRREFDVAPSQQRSTVVREVLPTSERAVTGELVGCADGPGTDASGTPAP
ncbi:MAG: Conserved rane protein of uncharacterized function [Frankiales bacterium]|nr:Conserved rane protein of uncharacterized function [Frankiales bacterium]